jgi:hypothetical protein
LITSGLLGLLITTVVIRKSRIICFLFLLCILLCFLMPSVISRQSGNILQPPATVIVEVQKLVYAKIHEVGKRLKLSILLCFLMPGVISRWSGNILLPPATIVVEIQELAHVQVHEVGKRLRLFILLDLLLLLLPVIPVKSSEPRASSWSGN